MTRHAKPLDLQLNLQLVDAPKTVIPGSKQRELSLALVELLVGAAQASNRQEEGGGDELEANRLTSLPASYCLCSSVQSRPGTP